MIDRRTVLTWVGGSAAVPAPTVAQTAGKTLRVAAVGLLPRSAPHWAIFLRRMAEIGYVEGKNFVFDYAQVPSADTLEAQYREAVARKPDVVVAGTEASLLAALAAAGKLPIVMIAVDYDPIARGHVASLARPGGQISGVYSQNAELAAKHLQLMKEMMPDVATTAVFWDRYSADYWAALQREAPKRGIKLAGVELTKRPYEYEAALEGLAKAERRFLIAQSSPIFFLDRVALAQAAIRHRTALFAQVREQVAAGALMQYSATLTEMYALATNFVDQIAKGAKPADLPVRQPTRFELTINLKTARALGLTVPPALLAQADEVIE
jgi:putative tryptophan/tyrosine transport system substrate-binding protein